MTTPDYTLPAVPVPAGAARVDDWEDVSGEPYRVFDGPEYSIGGKITVWAHGIQLADGTIDRGVIGGGPAIAVSGLSWEDGISAETARRLADVLMQAAEQIDRWSAPH